ncbi:MAG: tRNA dihydrouridine synthase DusB, partial [Verrucomicrobia bacterium]|nr:tRNA dihydrouridine synthase DusB [Verrucomicrobiota bacterium]
MAASNHPLTKIIYSPLAGCSDVPFRLMARRHGHRGLVFCEMVKMEALVREVPETLSYLEYTEEMHPIGAQIVGSRKDLAAPCAKIIEDLGFDVVDLNCGCPVDKVTKDGSGSALLREPERIGEIISNMCAAVKIPVTVKIRIGWDHSSINASTIVSIAEAAGAQMISIHGRTRQQGYEGKADRDVIAQAVKAAKTIKVGGNGDIFDPESALHMFAHTECDTILCSRGAMGQPWIGHDIERALQGLPPLSHDPLEALLEHIDLITQYRPERKHP